MRWSHRRARLQGEMEESDRLSDLGHKACPTCDSAFDSVALGFDRLGSADTEDFEALARYCQNVTAHGGQVSIHATRPALRRLLLAGPPSDFVAAKGDDEPGEGEPFTCPHR